jgi:hypothetical protein
MTDQAKPASRHWRKFLRFSVRGMILFVILFGAGLGWIVRKAHIQRDAVAAVLKAGGTVAHSWEYDQKPILRGRPSAPSWLVDLVGIEFFGHVTHVDLSGLSGPADSTLVEVGRLNQLQELWLGNASVTDAGLVHLKGMTNLSYLGLDGTQVTDAGLVHLKGLTNLKTLDLFGTQVTAAGVNELQQALPNLKITR